MITVPWIPLGLIGILSWSVWFVRRTLSHPGYREVVNDFRTTTSVVVLPARTPTCWSAASHLARRGPDRDHPGGRRRDDLRLRPPGRLACRPCRSAVARTRASAGPRRGVRAATGEVVVFADSDTAWRPGLLGGRAMPFVDPQVGGVGSRQHVYLPRANVWRRVAYWMLELRYLDYVPAMSRRGGVACLSGRTAAYRRSVSSRCCRRWSTRSSWAARASRVTTAG